MFNQRRALIVGVALIAASGFNAVTAPSSLARCARVEVDGHGNFKRSGLFNCAGPTVGGNFIKIKGNPAPIGDGQYCAATETLGEGQSEDNVCSKSKVGGNFIKVRMGSPVFYRRVKVGEEEGSRVEEASPEAFSGTGGTQELKVTIGTTPVLLTAAGVKIVGSIYNNELQGQVKLELKYPPIKIVEPKLPSCQVEVFSQPGGHNTVFAEGHLAWTWNGTKEQLLEEEPREAQKPDLIFTPPGARIQEGATTLPAGSFAEVKFAPTVSCGALAGIFKVSGSTIGSLKPEKAGEWSSKLIFTTPEGKAKQHFWNGKEAIGVETGLSFASNPASLIGENTLTTKDEVAIFEN